MNCPTCGAAMRVVARRHYFHCEHCGRYHFPEGTAEGVVVLEGPAGLDCPVCSQPLRDARLDGEPAGSCEHCRGVLIVTASFTVVVTKRRARQRAGEQPREPFDPAELKRGVDCPRCRRRMDTHAYSGGGNAVIDSCSQCNLVWLDAGELAIIERYVPSTHRIEPGLFLS